MQDLSRTITLACPACGCTQFESVESPGDSGGEANVQTYVCAHCGCSVSRDELIEANREAIDLTIDEIANSEAAGIAKALEEQFKKCGFKVAVR